LDTNSSDRRDTLKAGFALLAGSALGAGLVSSANAQSIPLASKALAPPDPQVHLLNRITYGVRAEELATARSMGNDAYVQFQLGLLPTVDAALTSYLNGALPTLNWTQQQILIDGQLPGRQQVAAQELIAATMLRQFYSARQLYEKMVEFWSDHFNVHLQDGAIRYYKPIEDRDAIRPNALGKFRDILGASAKSPAMLLFLDNASNVASAPNENYSRELMELHTLGVDGGYTEADVRAVARAFTGWTIARSPTDPNNYFTFRASLHDSAPKTVLGQALAAGRGLEDGEQVLDILAAHPSTAKFVSTKLARRFVSDAPPVSLINKLSANFLASGGDIKQLLTTLFSSEEFKASYDQKLKRPIEYVASSVRALVPFTFDTLIRTVSDRLGTLGQQHFNWAPPNGYPDVAAYWLSTTGLLGRWTYAFNLADGTLATSMQIKLFDFLGTARSAEAVVDRFSGALLQRALDPEDRARLIAFVARGDARLARLSTATVAERARSLIGVLLSSRYFQYH